MSRGSSIVAATHIDDAEAVSLRQAWLPGDGEVAFRPGSVRVAFSPEMIRVAAVLDDAHVFTRAVDGCRRLWELGDVFEMFFLRPGDSFYSELHVAPDGRTAHLRIPIDRRSALRSGEAVPEDFFQNSPAFLAVVRCEPFGWTVEAEIPVGAISGGGPLHAGERWRASFSRYDATPGESRAILSSTSPLVRPDFHAIDCWNELCF